MLAVTLLAVPIPCNSWNHSEIQWKTISTEHFEICFHPGAEWSAQQAAFIAEEIYGPVTEFYRYEPGRKIHIIISDKESISVGASYYYLNKIRISASDMEFQLRGASNWLRNVITHEFTHMVQIQKAMKLPRLMPSLYLQAIDFEREKRPDVITGYPNLQVSLPVAGELVPAWFAEGTAQYQCDRARNDIWDSHRDMLLRTAVLNDRLLSIDKMGVFGKNSLESEMVYNQGFSLVRFVGQRFGDERLTDLTAALSGIHRISFNGACRKALGISESKLFDLWKDKLRDRYGSTAEQISMTAVAGKRIAGKGFMNLFPVGNGGNDGIFFLSNRGRDFSSLDLVHLSGDGLEDVIADDVVSRASLAREGTKLCYARTTVRNRHGYEISDIFLFDVATGKERRLTTSLHALDPVWSPDDGNIAFVVNRDGTDRLALLDPESGRHRFIGGHAAGRKYFGLSWGSGGILASCFEGSSRDIVLIDPRTGNESVIVSTGADERDPSWSSDGSGFFYSSDRTGIFNLYFRNLADSTDLVCTNVIGGAFAPCEAGGRVLFASYGGDGYEIRELQNWQDSARKPDMRQDDRSLFRERNEYIAAGRSVSPRESDRSGGSALAGPGVADAGDFGIRYTPIYFFPCFMVYEGKPRIGLTVSSGDIIDRQSILAGASVNGDMEFDFSLNFEMRQFKPTLRFDVIRSRKHYDYISRLEDGNDYEFKTRYDLWDAFFTCTFELVPPTRFRAMDISLRYNHGEYGLNIEQWDLLDMEIGWTYYKGNEISILYDYRSIRRETDADINPRKGRTLHIEQTLALNKLDSGEFEYMLEPRYNKNYFVRYELAYKEYLPLPFWAHALTIFGRVGAITGIYKDVISDFFHLYIGSRDGLRGYSYYSLGGRKIAMGRLTYRFPLLPHIDKRIFHLYFSSIYAGLFAEAGKAWNDDGFDLRGNKKDVGFEVRLKGFSFYSFPLAASFEAAYGLNDIKYVDPFNNLLTFYEGKEWKFYGSALFSF